MYFILLMYLLCWFALYFVASEQVDPNQPMIVHTLGERTVAYYRVQIPPDGVTFKFDIQDGRFLICGSTNTRNPDCRDPSSYEWRCEANSFCNYYAIGMARKRRQTGSNFMFISIEGVEKTNNFTMEVEEGDKRISAGNVAKLAILYLISVSYS